MTNIIPSPGKQLTFPEFIYQEQTEIHEKIVAVNKAFDCNYQEPVPSYFVPVEETWIDDNHVAHTSTVGFNHFIDTRQINKDVPDNIQFFDMGLVERNNDHLDHRQLDDRDFRQRCITRDNSVNPLYEKRKVDIINSIRPTHYNPDWLIQILGEMYIGSSPRIMRYNSFFVKNWNLKSNVIVESIAITASIIKFDQAFKLANCFKRLELDRKAVLKIMYGYVSENGYKEGLVNCPAYLDKAIELLVEFADNADEVTIDSTNFVPNAAWYDEETIQSMNFGNFNPYDEEVTSNDDEMDFMAENNPFKSFRFSSEYDCLSHEFITMIKEADSSKLAEIQRGFFKQEDPYSGKLIPVKYWYLTKSQKAQAWDYIKDRKIILANQAKDNLSEDGQIVLSWIKQLGNNGMSSALIYSYMEGKGFNAFGTEIIFNQIPSKEEVSYIWSEYKKL